MIDGDVLLARRTDRGLSQRKLGKLVGVNGMTIQRIEHGSDASELPLAVLGRLADTLDVDAGDLLLGRRDASSVAAAPAPSDLDQTPLDRNAARLLRRVHRGDDIRRTMSRADREITLPALINRGLVSMTSSGAVLTTAVESSLSLNLPGRERRPKRGVMATSLCPAMADRQLDGG